MLQNEIDKVISDAEGMVRNCRLVIDEDKLRISQYEKKIARNEGKIEAIMMMVRDLKQGE
jgi:hypothetical protein